MTARVAIVVLNWNGKNLLERFLPVLQIHTPHWAHIVVADNASSDDSLDYIRLHHPEVGVVELDRNYGFAGGYNRALQKVDADYYVLLNSDIEVSAGWLEPLIQTMEDDSRVVACQPRILSLENRDSFEYAGASGGFLDRYGYPFCRGRLFQVLEKDHGQYNNRTQVFWASGAAFAVRSGEFHSAGGFDNGFFAHMEEIDLCWRFQRMGHRIMACPDSVVYHLGGASLPASNPRKTYLNFRNSLLTLTKNLPARLFYPSILLRLALDDLAAFRFLISGRWKDFLAVCRAQLAFLVRFPAYRAGYRPLKVDVPDTLYMKSILWAYYVRGVRRFSELNNRASNPKR